MSRKRNMPHKDKIHAFWVSKLEKYGIIHMQSLPMSNRKEMFDKYNHVCMACCTVHAYIERAHINSVDSGGSDDVDNLHLLCASCHKQSENLSGDAYNKWLIRKHGTDFTPHSLLELQEKYPEVMDFLKNPKDTGPLDKLKKRLPLLHAKIMEFLNNM